MPVIYNTVYALGDNPAYYYTRSGISVSYDSGATWASVDAAPFAIHEGIRTGDSNFQGWVLLSNAGGGVSNDQSDLVDIWGTPYRFEDPARQLRDITAASGELGWMAVGYQKDPISLAELATVVFTNTGVDSSSWQTKWISTNTHSGLNSILVPPFDSWGLAVGYKNGTDPLVIYTQDSGASWAELPLPSTVTGPLFCVTGNAQEFRIGGVGQIIKGTWNNGNVQWQLSQGLLTQGKAKAITFIGQNFDITQPIQTVALSGSSVFYSANGFDYQSITQPGYTFNTGVYVAARWIFGCTSLLNQYTGFYGSFEYTPDPRLVLTGFNNQVHTYKFLVR